jgi:hypothetical protein
MAEAHWQLQSGGTSKGASRSLVAKSKKRGLLTTCDADGFDSESQSSDEQASLDVPFKGPAHGEGLQRYYYTERERYLPLANITRSLKDAASFGMPGRNIKITKAGEVECILHPGMPLARYTVNTNDRAASAL